MSSTGSPAEENEFLRSVRTGAIIGALLLAVAIPWLRSRHEQAPPVAQAVGSAPPAREAARPLANFGDETPSQDARHVANWAFFTGDHQGKSVVVLDKKAARVYTFDPQGQLIAATPALLGAAIGDDAAPGIGDKPLAQIRPEEKTTHAGRFEAQPGINADGEDVVWIDYDAAISMHRVRPNVAAERRLERLASPSEEDNRISFGCVNLPVHFFEQVLSPTVKKTGAIVYVLPETRTPQEVFGSWDVTDPAARPVASAVRPGRARLAAPEPAARRERDQKPHAFLVPPLGRALIGMRR
jgi:hypothetical protein